jgi:exodeoxyribonuclease VII large subunit
MPEAINDKKVFSLREVTVSVQKTIETRYKSSFWVKAEMNKLNHYTHSGHCYPELVEKQNGKVVAQIRSNLWKNDYLSINAKFEKILMEPLRDGITILFCARLSFDPVYGLCLRILDIDPVFSLGELEKEKLETIARLKKEEVFEKNKARELPLVPQRIAIISVETSKGYSDFLQVIDRNPWGYKFFHCLFPALLQGDKSVKSICRQLRQVKKVLGHFDVVAIIRGGGGDVGLSSYNNYQLAKEICMFPIPVITGIGHSTNDTVAEMVSYKNAITPTELADFLIQKFHNFASPVQKAETVIIEKAKRILQEEKLKFHNTLRLFRSVTGNLLFKNRTEIQNQSKVLTGQCNFILKNEKEAFRLIASNMRKSMSVLFDSNRSAVQTSSLNILKESLSYLKHQKTEVNTIEKNIEIMSPVNVLRRGYSITLFNGKAVKNHRGLKEGDEISTIIEDGQIISNINQLKNNTDHE